MWPAGPSRKCQPGLTRGLRQDREPRERGVGAQRRVLAEPRSARQSSTRWPSSTLGFNRRHETAPALVVRRSRPERLENRRRCLALTATETSLDARTAQPPRGERLRRTDRAPLGARSTVRTDRRGRSPLACDRNSDRAYHGVRRPAAQNRASGGHREGTPPGNATRDSPALITSPHRLRIVRKCAQAAGRPDVLRSPLGRSEATDRVASRRLQPTD